MVGPSSKFSDDQIEEMLERMALGEAICHIEREPGMPSANSMERWEAAGDELGGRITQARARGMDYIAAQAVKNAKAAEDPALGRLAFDADRWYLSKLAPKRYGDKLDVEHGVSSSLGAILGRVDGRTRTVGGE